MVGASSTGEEWCFCRLTTHLCEAGAAAFNAVERLVHLVGAVDAEIELRSAGTHSDGHTHTF